MAPSTDTTSRVLLVEDNAGDARLVEGLIQREAPANIRLEHVTSLASARDRLRTGGFGAVILDLGLPDSHGVETIAGLEAANDVPILVLSGYAAPNARSEALSMGAAEFFDKNDLPDKRLVSALRRLLDASKPDSNEEVGTDRWLEFLATSTATINSRLYRAVAWLEAADEWLDRADSTVVGESKTERDALHDALGGVQRALAGAKDEVRGVLARGLRFGRTLPRERSLVATERLEEVVDNAREILAAQSFPRFDVRSTCEFMPDLAVDGHALLRTVRQVCRAIEEALTSPGADSCGLSLSTLRCGDHACLAIDADVPSLDPARLQALLPESRPPRDGEADGRPSAVRMKSLRGGPDRTMVSFEIRLGPIPPTEGGERGPRALGAALETLQAALTQCPREHPTVQDVAQLDGALVRVLQAWPIHESSERRALDDLARRVPRLTSRCERARDWLGRLSAELSLEADALEHLAHSMKQRATPADRAAVAAVADALTQWTEAVARFDQETRRLQLEAFWTDIGTID